jgi:hypothetical protein
MKIPAAMASKPMIKPRPEKLKPSMAINPDRMSQMASNNMPIFRVIFIKPVLSSVTFDLKVPKSCGPIGCDGMDGY